MSQDIKPVCDMKGCHNPTMYFIDGKNYCRSCGDKYRNGNKEPGLPPAGDFTPVGVTDSVTPPKEKKPRRKINHRAKK
jgi:hypothetical protein